jgi:hypothetical protein
MGGGSGQAWSRLATPAFCPSYSWTAWGGEDPVSRAAQNCQAKLDKLLDDSGWPAQARLPCKCSLAVRNMTVLDSAVLMRGTRYTALKLFTRQGTGAVRKRDGILEYEKDDLVKQNFAMFNGQKIKICAVQLEFKLGEVGRFFGTCLGDNPIREGGVMIGCASGIFCKRHMVGNMKMGNGTIIGFAWELSDKKIAEKYPNLPQKFEVEDASVTPKEEEFNQ